jgi:hypothetical protein
MPGTRHRRKLKDFVTTQERGSPSGAFLTEKYLDFAHFKPKNRRYQQSGEDRRVELK